jgi:hypothetical protein
MRIDPTKARLSAVVLFTTAAALVALGLYLRGQQNAGGIAVMAAGLADATIGIVLLGKSRM